jgi:hypothetical protein
LTGFYLIEIIMIDFVEIEIKYNNKKNEYSLSKLYITNEKDKIFITLKNLDENLIFKIEVKFY